MKLYSGEESHDDTPLCACEKCRRAKGKTLYLDKKIDGSPLDNKQKTVTQTYVLQKFPNGYAYMDKNLLTMGWHR